MTRDLATSQYSCVELYPVYMMLSIFADSLCNSKIIFYSDNEAVVAVLNAPTSKCSQIISIIRNLVFVLLLNNISLRARHLPVAECCFLHPLSSTGRPQFLTSVWYALEADTRAPTPAARELQALGKLPSSSRWKLSMRLLLGSFPTASTYTSTNGTCWYISVSMYFNLISIYLSKSEQSAFS